MADITKTAAVDTTASVDPEKNAVQESSPQQASGYESDEKSQDFQGGVQGARAMTSVWTNKTLISMFVMLYLVSFIDILLQSVQSSLNPYITSSFGKHGLLNVVSILSTVLSGATKLTLAKVVDIWGRIEGFVVMLLIVTIGLIMKATCQTIEVYVGAHVLYWTGHIGLMYIIDIMIADMTTLKNRMIIAGINGTPTICSTFAGPKIADLFYTNFNFRWAFGAFAIMQVGICLPVFLVMLLEQRKAAKQGLIKPKEASGRNIIQSLWHYFIELDVIGIILIVAAFSLFLLPFSLVSYSPYGWKTGYIIAMIIIGILCFPAFALWEWKVAPVKFIPWKYLKNPTILGSCLLYGAMFISTFCWDAYFYSYLQVVNRLSITTAGYVLNAYSLSSAVFAPFIGAAISYTGDFKWSAIAGVPLMLLGTALLIPLRTPETGPGLITMTQIFVGVGAQLFASCGQLAVQVPVTHQEIAVVLAIWGMFGSFGAAIGNAIAGALWNNILPEQLLLRLPESVKNQSATIYGDMVLQMSYEDGTPEREAIVGAYGYLQRRMVIAGACFMPLCLFAIFVWKNTNIRKLQSEQGIQTKGRVF
ncbi:unnamed protein product [Clonostachys byssicola]|uniref:Siderophore iron transporter mirB n=1 Tax=Clonostachys byssicola TaxID=160290 RepID=A0A9N9Y1C5_9HYPO|nr:unnamed protein product [Clonostachys byssicola]